MQLLGAMVEKLIRLLFDTLIYSSNSVHCLQLSTWINSATRQFLAMKLHKRRVLNDVMVNSIVEVEHFEEKFVKVVQNQLIF